MALKITIAALVFGSVSYGIARERIEQSDTWNLVRLASIGIVYAAGISSGFVLARICGDGP